MAISQKTLKEHWGVDAAYVSRCVKRGCPLDSLETADTWRQAHAQRGVGYRSKERKQMLLPAPPAPPPADLTIDGRPLGELDPAAKSEAGDLLSVLDRVIYVEKLAYRLAEETATGRRPGSLTLSISAYNKATENRLKTEAAVREWQKESEQLITLDAAKEICVKAWGPLLARLRSLPKRAGMKANPTDDVHAEAIIRQEIEEAIAEARKIFDVDLRSEATGAQASRHQEGGQL